MSPHSRRAPRLCATLCLHCVIAAALVPLVPGCLVPARPTPRIAIPRVIHPEPADGRFLLPLPQNVCPKRGEGTTGDPAAAPKTGKTGDPAAAPKTAAPMKPADAVRAVANPAAAVRAPAAGTDRARRAHAAPAKGDSARHAGGESGAWR